MSGKRPSHKAFVVEDRGDNAEAFSTAWPLASQLMTSAPAQLWLSSILLISAYLRAAF